MKKLLAVLLALMMTAALAACGKEPAPNPEHPPETDVSGAKLGEEPVEITFWHSMSEDAGERIDSLVKTFNETVGAENKVTVTAVYQGKYSDATTKLRAVLATQKPEDLPDVMQMDATAKILYAESGRAYTFDRILADHPDYDEEQIYEGLRKNWTYRDVKLGIPFAASTTVLYYNKTVLDAAGVKAPETLADIAALAGKLPAGVGAYSDLPNSASMNNWIQQLGGKTFDLDNGTLGGAAKLTAAGDGTLLTFLKEWKALYESGALNNSGSANTDAFVAGRTALMTGSTSALGGILQKVNGSFEVGVAYFPRVNEKAKVGATSSGSALMAFDRGDALKMKAAWCFMQFMTSPEMQASFAGSTGYLPVNKATAEEKSYKELLTVTPQFGVGVQQLAETDPGFTSVTVGPAADIYYAVQNNISEMLESELSPEDTVLHMQEELEGILAAYNRANS